MATAEPTAAVASTGKGIRYIAGGMWAAYSGEIDVAQNTNTNLLEFTSPAVALNATLCFGLYGVDIDSGRRIFSDIGFNELRVLRRNTEYSPATGVIPNSIFAIPIYIIIPALTKVTIAVEHDETSNIPFTVVLSAEEL